MLGTHHYHGGHRNTPDCILPWLIAYSRYTDYRRLVARVNVDVTFGRGVGGGDRGVSVHAAYGGVEVGGGQLTGGSGTELQAGDELRHTEVFLRRGTALHLQADGEDGKVGELDVLAEQKQFLGADHGIGEDALDGSLTERGVVACHVLRQLVETDGLLHGDPGVPLAERLGDFLVLVLVEFDSNHTVRKNERFANEE